MKKPLIILTIFALEVSLAVITIFAVPAPNVGTVAFTVTYDFASNPDFAHFNIYFGQSSSNYTASASMSSTNFTLTGFQRNQTYYFNMTAVSTNGLESDYTTEQFLRINNKPKPVAAFQMSQ